MKKRTVYIVLMLTLFTALAALLTGCSGEDFSQTLAEAERINSESNLGLTFLEPMGLTEEDARLYGDDHPGGDMTEDGYVRGYYFKRNEQDTDRYLTQIRILGGDYDILGIKLGMSLDEGEKMLEQQGYRKGSKPDYYTGLDSKAYRKGRIEILLEHETDAGEIKSMYLHLLPV